MGFGSTTTGGGDGSGEVVLSGVYGGEGGDGGGIGSILPSLYIASFLIKQLKNTYAAYGVK